MLKIKVKIFTIFLVLIAISCGKEPQKKLNQRRVEAVKRGTFRNLINSTGNLEPLISVEVKSNVEGEVTKLYVVEGEYVEKGQLLIEIDPKQIIEGKRQAEANVAAAKAQLRQAELNIELKITELETQLQQNENSVKISEANLRTTIVESQSRITQAETDLQTTKNSLDQDQLALEQAKLSLSQAEITLTDYEESLKSAEVAKNNAEAELKRTQELYDKKYVPKKSLEEAESRNASAVSQYNSAVQRVASQKKAIESQKKTVTTRETIIETRKTTIQFQKSNLEKLREMREAQEDRDRLQFEISKSQLNRIKTTIDQEKVVVGQQKVIAEAGVLRNESTLINQQERLDWTKIIAPMSGTITELNIEEGEIVTSGRSAFSQSPPLMTIADLSKMVAKTFINEVDMEELRRNQIAEIMPDAYQGKKYRGRVTEISPIGIERDNIISFEVMVEVIGSPAELRPGMSADVDIITYEEQNVLMVSLEALQDEKSITANIRSDAGDLKNGRAVQLKNSAGKSFDGKVTEINAGEITIELDSSQRGLRRGPQTVSILANSEVKLEGVSAVIKIQSLKYATIADGDSSTENGGVRTSVEVDKDNGTEAIVKNGLKEGDRVLLGSTPPQMGGRWGG